MNLGALQQLSDGSTPEAVLILLIAFIAYIVVGLVPVALLVYALHFLLTLPMRRCERARFFLELLDLGLKNGRTPEDAVTDAAASHDAALGFRFQLVAAHLRQGLRLSPALGQEPRLLPPEVNAMLATGERIGSIAAVLPACRLLLRDGTSQVRGALNYFLLLLFLGVPFTLAVPVFLGVKVLPSFQAVFSGMLEGTDLPAFTRFVFASKSAFLAIQAGVFGVVWLAALLYLGGPRLRCLVGRLAPGVLDRLLYWLPWRRKRMQRDFSSMLAVLLEAEVPEAEAVRLAAQSTANEVIRCRAEKVCARLQTGVKLPEAIGLIDDSGELRWRLGNALRPGGGFVRALAGWHEALDAKAFQLEQVAAQSLTTVLVLINGAIIACLVIGMFLPLIQLTNLGILW